MSAPIGPAPAPATTTAVDAPIVWLTLAEAAEAAHLPARWLRVALTSGWVARGGPAGDPRFDAAGIGALGNTIRFERQYARQRLAANRRNRAG